MNEVLIGQIIHSFGHLQTHGEQLQLDFFDLNGIKPSRENIAILLYPVGNTYMSP